MPFVVAFSSTVVNGSDVAVVLEIVEFTEIFKPRTKSYDLNQV